MGHANPIYLVGHQVQKGYTQLSNELIRTGGHPNELGPDGLMVVANLVSHARPLRPNEKPWETSAKAMSEQFGWSRNGDRAKAAIERAEKEKRLVRRRYVRDGKEIPNRWAYVVCPGGRRFTDEELSLWSRPIEK